MWSLRERVRRPVEAEDRERFLACGVERTDIADSTAGDASGGYQLSAIARPCASVRCLRVHSAMLNLTGNSGRIRCRFPTQQEKKLPKMRRSILRRELAPPPDSQAFVKSGTAVLISCVRELHVRTCRPESQQALIEPLDISDDEALDSYRSTSWDCVR